MLYLLEARVIGKVQRVMFRDFVLRKAKKLKLSGFVQNQKDGTVLVKCCGNKEDIEKMLENLKEGPFLANVKNVEYNIGQVDECKFNDFKIIYRNFLDRF